MLRWRRAQPSPSTACPSPEALLCAHPNGLRTNRQETERGITQECAEGERGQENNLPLLQRKAFVVPRQEGCAGRKRRTAATECRLCRVGKRTGATGVSRGNSFLPAACAPLVARERLRRTDAHTQPKGRMSGMDTTACASTALAGVGTAILLLWYALRSILGTNGKMAMRGKHCLVTGGSSGIGKELAKVLSLLRGLCLWTGRGVARDGPASPGDRPMTAVWETVVEGILTRAHMCCCGQSTRKCLVRMSGDVFPPITAATGSRGSARDDCGAATGGSRW